MLPQNSVYVPQLDQAVKATRSDASVVDVELPSILIPRTPPKQAERLVEDGERVLETSLFILPRILIDI